MKKYLAAAVVALMVFAFSAFAASLNVNAGTLQAGQDMDLECADGANVVAWGYNDHLAVGPVISYADVMLVNNECDNDEHLHVVLLDENATELARGHDGDGTAPRLIDPSEDRYRFWFGDNAPGQAVTDGVQVGDIEGVRIGIDQGHQDYTFD